MAASFERVPYADLPPYALQCFECGLVATCVRWHAPVDAPLCPTCQHIVRARRTIAETTATLDRVDASIASIRESLRRTTR